MRLGAAHGLRRTMDIGWWLVDIWLLDIGYWMLDIEFSRPPRLPRNAAHARPRFKSKNLLTPRRQARQVRACRPTAAVVGFMHVTNSLHIADFALRLTPNSRSAFACRPPDCALDPYLVLLYSLAIKSQKHGRHKDNFKFVE